MEIFKDYPLKDKNTFGIDAIAKQYAKPKSIEELAEIISSDVFDSNQFFILGGGSNVLFTGHFDGLIIHPEIKGKTVVSEDENYVLVKANAGENWDSFVEWTVNKGYSGLENLSLIPGTVGASPIQNIGAYGVEVGDLIDKLEAYEISSGKIKEFVHDDCDFAYRNSVFKGNLRNKYVIISVYYSLSKKPIFKTHYGSVEEELKKMGDLNLNNIRQAIINIRESKLPPPEVCPNAGSFCKNPLVSALHADKLKVKFPEIVMYKAENNQYKLAAGWMIDYLGWKGKSFGGAAVHDKQALVLVNKANASGNEIIYLAGQIKKSVADKFDVDLEFEVNIL